MGKNQIADLSCARLRNVCLAADLFWYARVAAGCARGAKAGNRSRKQPRYLERFSLREFLPVIAAEAHWV
jgi:hypothetical protein